MTEKFSEPTSDQLTALYQDILPGWEQRVAEMLSGLPSRQLRKAVGTLPEETVGAITEVLDDTSIEARVEQRVTAHDTSVQQSWRELQRLDPRDIMNGDMRAIGGSYNEFSQSSHAYMSLAEFEHSSKQTKWRTVAYHKRATEYTLATVMSAPVFYETSERRQEVLRAGLNGVMPELVARYLRGKYFNEAVARMNNALDSLSDTSAYPARYHGLLWQLGRLVSGNRWDAHGNMQEKALMLHARKPLNRPGRPPISDEVIDRGIVHHFPADSNYSTHGASLAHEVTPLGLASFGYRAYAAHVNYDLKSILGMDAEDIDLMS